MDSLRTEHEHLVLVDAGSFTGTQFAAFHDRTVFLCEMMKEMGYDALTIGDGEVRLGAEPLRRLISDSSIPFVSANLIDLETDELLMPEYRVVTKGDTRVAITAITVPTKSMQELWTGIGVGARPAAEVLPAVVGRMRREADVVILLARHPLDETKLLIEEIGGGVDVVVMGNPRSVRERTLQENAGAVYATSGNRGQALAITEVALGPDGRPEGMATSEMVLSRDVAEDPDIVELVRWFEASLNGE